MTGNSDSTASVRAAWRLPVGVVLVLALLGSTAAPVAEAILPPDPNHEVFASTDVPKAIPDYTNPPVGAVSTLTIPQPGRIADLDVAVQLGHTYIGDLEVTLAKAGTGISVVLIDRPGVPATGTGCSGDNIDAVLDDEALDPIEDECVMTSLFPAVFGRVSPNEALSAFDGTHTSGTDAWVLTVVDHAAVDTGTLVAWELHVEFEPEPEGTMIVIKDAVPDDPQDFEIGGTFSGTFYLDDDNDPTLPNQWSAGATPNIYEFIEELVPGWELTGLSCDDANSQADLAARRVDILLEDGETVTCTFTNTRQIADLSLSKAGDRTAAAPGELVVFTVAVTNAGPHQATTVTVLDLLPSGYTYVSDDAGSGGDGSYDVGTGLWFPGDVAVGQTRSFHLTAELKAAGDRHNVAQVVHSDAHDPDSTPGNSVPSEDDQDAADVVVPTCNGRAATMVGTDLNDSLVGGPGPDVIVGLGHNDRIFGGGGDDTICAGAGNDSIEGGPGNDWIDGEAGFDHVTYVNAPAGVTVDLGAGSASGGDGSDTLVRIRDLTGSEHDDKLSGNAFANLIEGLDGNDKIKGKKGDDILYGHDGDDVIQGRQGDDLIDGGPGSDTASYFVAKAPIIVDLAALTASGDGNDHLVGIENVSGSKQGDDITGDGLANRLIGFKGADVLDGAGGDDTIRGKPGDDTMFGGPGDDRLLGGGGDDYADGGPGDDVCRAETTTAC